MASITEIAKWYKVRGSQVILSEQNSHYSIIAPRAIELANINHISFVNGKYSEQFLELLKLTQSKLIVIDESLLENVELKNLPNNITFIISSNPKEDIIDYCKHFLGFEKDMNKSNISSTSSIAKSVKIESFVNIGANVIIEDNVVLGNNCRIGANTLIKENTIVGNNVEIGACNVIGGVGFGYAQNKETKKYEQFPHYGKVIIHDNVSIGNNTCIDRGSLSDTVIHEGVKIDNLVHIAHNVQIGENTLIIAKSMIAGSVVIGKNCWIAPSSCLRNGIKIGDNAVVGLASTVTKNVGNGETVVGSPAIPLSEFIKKRKQQT